MPIARSFISSSCTQLLLGRVFPQGNQAEAPIAVFFRQHTRVRGFHTDGAAVSVVIPATVQLNVQKNRCFEQVGNKIQHSSLTCHARALSAFPELLTALNAKAH
jgi:hypothetical protein